MLFAVFQIVLNARRVHRRLGVDVLQKFAKFIRVGPFAVRKRWDDALQVVIGLVLDAADLA